MESLFLASMGMRAWWADEFTALDANSKIVAIEADLAVKARATRIVYGSCVVIFWRHEHGPASAGMPNASASICARSICACC